MGTKMGTTKLVRHFVQGARVQGGEQQVIKAKLMDRDEAVEFARTAVAAGWWSVEICQVAR